MDTTPLYILKMCESNFKKIKVLEFEPHRGVNKIAGVNAVGKSSCLDGIIAAIGGPKHFPQKPVREGEESAGLVCVLGDDKPDMLVKRVIHANGRQSLELTSADGLAPTPQTILDGLYSKFAFAPQNFLFMDDDQQVKTLRELVGLDFTEMDAKRKTVYDERTQVNKQAKQLAAQAIAVIVPAGTPAEEVSLADLMAEQQNRLDHNRLNQRERDKVQILARDADSAGVQTKRLQDGVADLEKRLAKMREELAKAESAKEQAESLLGAQKSTVAVLEDKDVSAIQRQIVEAQSVNAFVAKAKRKQEIEQQASELQAKSKALTGQIDAIDQEKERLLAEAKWPVDGLSFSEDGVLYNGIPFSQASSAEQLRVSFAMAAAMSPRLRVAIIKNASMLDEDQMQVVCDMAERLKIQVFLEVVDRDGEGATLVLEDGEIAKPKARKNKKADIPEPATAGE